MDREYKDTAKLSFLQNYSSTHLVLLTLEQQWHWHCTLPVRHKKANECERTGLMVSPNGFN